MSIQKKLIAIIVIVCLAATVAASFMLWSSYTLRNKAQFVVPALIYLESIAKTGTIISSQSRVASDYMVTGAAASRKEFEEYSTRADLAFQEWKSAILEQKLLNVSGEDEDLETQISIENKYNEWRKEARDVMDRKGALKGPNRNMNKLILPLDDAILTAVDSALEDGIEEVHTAYHNLLMSMGVIPWFVMSNTEQMERAHIAIDYFVAVTRTSGNLNKQLKEMMNYIQSGEADHLEEISRNGIQTEDALSMWAESVNREKQLDNNGINESTLPLQLMISSYKQVKSLIDLIVLHKQAGGEKEAIALERNQLQVLLEKQVLPAVSLAKADSKMKINNVSNRLISTAKSAVWQALFAIFCVTLLISALVFRLMKMLSTSITQLMNGIENIGTGNLDNRLNSQTHDELGKLAASLDAMSERLQQSYNENANLNACLEQKVEQLETANREIESFSYMLSHDMRNPVSAITCYTEMLLNESSTPLDKELSNYLERIQYSSLRLTHLIDDILLLSQVTHTDVVRDELNASRIADQIMHDLVQREPDRKINFICQPDVNIHASSQLVTVLLENLLGNAWKYSSTQEQSVIEFGQIRKEGELVCFVRDNGVGFDAADAQNIFQVFKRLHTRQEFEGTGIGLAIVQKIVSCHNGMIWAESSAGEGATFYFTLSGNLSKQSHAQ